MIQDNALMPSGILPAISGLNLMLRLRVVESTAGRVIVSMQRESLSKLSPKRSKPASLRAITGRPHESETDYVST